jgi:Fe-S-cluster containining protein
MIAYVTDEEIKQWKDQGREDILHIISNEKVFWAGDHLVSARDGRVLKVCSFLKWEGDYCSCSIYEVRPRVCRDYEPGSSQICPLWKPPDQS